MPAPANDNLASAAVIIGLSGSVSSNNNSATVESGEPGWPKNALTGGSYNGSFDASEDVGAPSGPDATVWYSWTCPPLPVIPPEGTTTYTPESEAEFLFTTEDDVANITNFRSVVQVFEIEPLSSGSVVQANLKEMALLLDERVGRNCGFSNGACVSFLAVPGTTYYIRVGGINNAQGNFKLSWRAFDQPTFGACSQCGPTTLGEQVASWQIDVTTNNTTPTFNAPYSAPYSFYYCKGAYIWGGLEPHWSVAAGSGGSGTTYLDLNVGSTLYSIPTGSYDSAGSCEIANSCLEVMPGQPIVICGGTAVSFTFFDAYLPDNITPGSTAPVIQMVAEGSFPAPGVTANVSGSDISVAGGGYSATFEVSNTGFPMSLAGSVTATLQNTGGVTGASAPVVGAYGVGSSAGNFSFTFNALLLTQFCTATVVLTVTGCGDVIATLEYPLYPIFSLNVGSPSGTNSCGGSLSYWYTQFDCALDCMFGLTGIAPILFLSTSSVVPLVNNICVVVASQSDSTTTTGVVDDILFQHQASITNTVLTIASTWGGNAYPNFTQTVAVP